MGVERQSDFDRKARTAERRVVMIGVRIRRAGEPWFQSRVADLSVTGFRLQSFMKLAIGSELWVMLPGFEARRARVQWTRGHEAGCLFERALHPAILDHIVAVDRQQSGG